MTKALLSYTEVAAALLHGFAFLHALNAATISSHPLFCPTYSENINYHVSLKSAHLKPILSSSIHNYLSDPALLGVQYWLLTIYLNFYLGSPAPCTHNQFLPLTFLPMALPSPSESFLVPSSPELQHSIGCQIIYNLPIHQLESILSFLFLLLPPC